MNSAVSQPDPPVAPATPTVYAYAIVTLCVLACMTEGYDLQAMAFAAPIIKAGWGLRAVDIAGLISISIIGVVLGSFLLAPYGDRRGRRPCILAALGLAGVATLGSAYAPNLPLLMASRFIAGLGLGLALPNVTALAMEIMPASKRAFVVVLVSCGYPLGAATGGVFAGSLIADHGYPAIFLLGGWATLAMMAICGALLPEFPAFLVRDPQRHGQMRTLTARLGLPQGDARAQADGSPRRSKMQDLAALFSPKRRRTTSLLWTVSFLNVALAYFFVSWLPTIFVARGMSSQFAINGTSLFGLSGMVGGLCMGALFVRIGGTRLLAIGYATIATTSLVLTALSSVDAFFLAVLALTGAAVVGSQFCLNAVVALYYPTDIRATAGGFAAGVGRIGAITAPLAGASFAQLDGFGRFAFALATGPALIALVATLALHFYAAGKGSGKAGAKAGAQRERGPAAT